MALTLWLIDGEQPGKRCGCVRMLLPKARDSGKDISAWHVGQWLGGIFLMEQRYGSWSGASPTQREAYVAATQARELPAKDIDP